MSADTKQSMGYFVAGFGALILLITLFLLYKGILPVTETKGVLIALIIVSTLLIGLGMYAVQPKESHDFVSDVGGVARDIVPKWGLKSQTGQSPVAVAPAPGQSAVVTPPAGDPVAVSPEGNVTKIDPETATGPGLPLIGQTPSGNLYRNESAAIKRALQSAIHPVGAAQRKRQDLYPPDEA